MTMQRNWIGRSEGASVTFEIAETGDRRRGVHDPSGHAVGGHVLRLRARASRSCPSSPRRVAPWSDVRAMLEAPAGDAAGRPASRRRAGRASALGVHAVNPVNGEKVPVFVAPYVLMEYGTGAVMGVPAHDQRDFEFAREHGLPIRVVVQPEGEQRDPDDDDRGVRPRGRDGELGTVRRRALARVDRAGHGVARGAGQGDARGHVPAARLADQRASGTGARRSRSCTAPSTARWRSPTISSRCCSPTTWTSGPAASRRSRATRGS